MAGRKTKKNIKKKILKKITKKTPKKMTVKTPKKATKKTRRKAAQRIIKKLTRKTPKKAIPKKIKTRKTVRVKPRKIVKRKLREESEEERKVALRRSLVQKREEIVKEAKTEISKYIKGEARQLVDTALDNGDWSVIDLSEDISLRQLSTHRENLLKIDEAIRKINEGTYGICEDCGEEINEARLKVLPFATHCRDCQEIREQLAVLEREGVG